MYPLGVPPYVDMQGFLYGYNAWSSYEFEDKMEKKETPITSYSLHRDIEHSNPLHLSVDLESILPETGSSSTDKTETSAIDKDKHSNDTERNEIGDKSSLDENEEKESLVFNISPERSPLAYENTLGMTVTSGSVTIQKDSGNLIGISIGGGAPLCPCLYIVQVFDNTPAARDGTLQAGDELTGIDGTSVKGKTKVEVAKMIQAAKDEVHINYNKLHADPRQGKSLDIVLKKVKHRLVENMSTATADALGLSRAILCNDTLVKKLEELHGTELMYKGLVEHSKRVLQAYADVMTSHKAFGDAFASIGVREPQPRASEAFRKFGEQHRQMEKEGQKMLQAVKPVLSDMGTYLHKAIPDTRLTIKKYADAKFEYLSYCLKVKEMDDEESSYAALQEPLYRVDTGNYEYRLILRCRQEARSKFAKLRSDVLVKMELLDNKHAEAVGQHLGKLLTGLQKLHADVLIAVEGPKLFPVEVDLTQNAFQYKSTTPVVPFQDEDDDISEGHEAQEDDDVLLSSKNSDEVASTQFLLDIEPQSGSVVEAPVENTTGLPSDLFDGLNNGDDQLLNNCIPQTTPNITLNSLNLEQQCRSDNTSNVSWLDSNIIPFNQTSSSNNLSSDAQTPNPNSLSPSVFSPPRSSSSDYTSNSVSPVVQNATTDSQKPVDVLLPGLEDLSVGGQVEPDYSMMDNATLLAGLNLTSSITINQALLSGFK